MGFIRKNFGGGAERKAADAQVAASDRALDRADRADLRAREDLQPFRDAGAGVLDDLTATAGAESPRSGLERFVLDDFDDTAARDSRRERVLDAVQASAAAGGRLASGGTLEELTRQLGGLEAEFDVARRGRRLNELATLDDSRFRRRGQRFGELFNTASLGSNAAARQATGTLNTAALTGNLEANRGNALAAGVIGSKNAIAGTIGGLGRLVLGL